MNIEQIEVLQVLSVDIANLMLLKSLKNVFEKCPYFYCFRRENNYDFYDDETPWKHEELSFISNNDEYEDAHLQNSEIDDYPECVNDFFVLYESLKLYFKYDPIIQDKINHESVHVFIENTTKAVNKYKDVFNVLNSVKLFG